VINSSNKTQLLVVAFFNCQRKGKEEKVEEK